MVTLEDILFENKKTICDFTLWILKTESNQFVVVCNISIVYLCYIAKTQFDSNLEFSKVTFQNTLFEMSCF